MNAARRLAALSALLALAAGAAQGQTIRFRMLDHSQTGWRSSGFSSVTCDANGGFLRRASHTTSWVFNNSGAGAFGKNAALQGALQTWTNVTDADFVLTLSGISSAPGFKQSDGVNSFSWGTDGICDSSSCHAITALLIGPGQQIVESDILFNNSAGLGFNWTTNGDFSEDCAETDGSNGLFLDTQGIATHELGHALGISHPTNASNTSATMGNVACKKEGRTLETDDVLALRCSEDRYPQNPAYQGVLTATDCRTISGWAWNANQGYQRSYVELVEDLAGGGVRIHRVKRADGSGATVGDGNHAFVFTTPATLQDHKPHTLRVRYSGNQANLAPPFNLTCP